MVHSSICCGPNYAGQVNKVFPKFIAKEHVSEDVFNKVKEISIQIATDFIEKGMQNEDVFRPIPIIGDFIKIPDYNCAATSPHRRDSLHIYPKELDNGVVFDEIIFPKRCEGFNTFVHGGYSTMALDEIMIFAVLHKYNLMPLTQKLEDISFMKPVYISRKYRLEAVVKSGEGNTFYVEGKIVDGESGTTCVTAKGKFFVPTLKLAKGLFGTMAENRVLKERFIS